jgi:hypothetical protein
MGSLYPHSATVAIAGRPALSLAELARVRAAAGRPAASREHPELPLATALLIAQAAGLYVGDDR